MFVCRMQTQKIADFCGLASVKTAQRLPLLIRMSGEQMGAMVSF